jgi:hypothetical protein
MAMTDREYLEQQHALLIHKAAIAMASAGKLVEMPVLRVLDQDSLQEIINYYGLPLRAGSQYNPDTRTH